VVTIGGDSPNALGMSEFADASGRRVDAETRLNQLLPDDISHVQFTSGTTGRPKGAMLRHGASVRTSRAWIANCGLVEGDRYPVVAPFSHLGGHKTGLLACLLARATAFPVAMFDVRELADMIRNHGLTFMQGPPTMFRALVELARSDGAPLSSVRVCVTGASVVPPSLVRDLRTVLGAPVVLTAYGLTESTGVCCMTRPGDDVDTVATTTGRPLPGIELRTVHPDGSDAGTDERGEVLVRGASVMAGYLDDSSATERAIRDGWLHTGDVGVLDANGRLRIVDRLTDMVVVGGLNVYPAEIEHALLDHPDVVAVAVIGIADERLGEVPAAFVVVGPAISNVDDALRTWCARRLAKFKIPRHFFATDELPVNAAGKVSKPELREQAATRVAALDATRTGAAVTATATTGSDR